MSKTKNSKPEEIKLLCPKERVITLQKGTAFLYNKNYEGIRFDGVLHPLDAIGSKRFKSILYVDHSVAMSGTSQTSWACRALNKNLQLDIKGRFRIIGRRQLVYFTYIEDLKKNLTKIPDKKWDLVILGCNLLPATSIDNLRKILVSKLSEEGKFMEYFTDYRGWVELHFPRPLDKFSFSIHTPR